MIVGAGTARRTGGGVMLGHAELHGYGGRPTEGESVARAVGWDGFVLLAGVIEGEEVDVTVWAVLLGSLC